MYLSTDEIDNRSDTLDAEKIHERIDDLAYELEGEYPAVMILPPGNDAAWGAVLLGCVMGCDSYEYRKAVNVTLRDASTWELPDAKLSAAVFDAQEALDACEGLAGSADYAEAARVLAAAMVALADDVPEDVTSEMQELIALREFADEFDSNASILIHEDYFENYARQYADDIGATNRNESWPYSYVDWEKAADALKQDFSAADFNGVTYYFAS